MPKVLLILIGVPHLLTLSHYAILSIRRAREKDRPFHSRTYPFLSDWRHRCDSCIWRTLRAGLAIPGACFRVFRGGVGPGPSCGFRGPPAQTAFARATSEPPERAVAAPPPTRRANRPQPVGAVWKLRSSFSRSRRLTEPRRPSGLAERATRLTGRCLEGRGHLCLRRGARAL